MFFSITYAGRAGQQTSQAKQTKANQASTGEGRRGTNSYGVALTGPNRTESNRAVLHYCVSRLGSINPMQDNNTGRGAA